MQTLECQLDYVVLRVYFLFLYYIKKSDYLLPVTEKKGLVPPS
jgi:hypothetical protein